MNFKAFLIARRRGVILRALESAAPGVTVAVDLLHRYCVAIGLRPTQEAVEEDLHWLAERRLVELGTQSELTVARITQTGREVSAERQSVPGVDVSERAGS